MKKILLLLPLFVFVLSSCRVADKEDSSDFDQSLINTNYSITSYESGKDGDAGATFNVEQKGKRLVQLKLDGKSNLRYNGRELKTETTPILGGIYYTVGNVKFGDQHTFVYTDNNGKKYTNSISMQPISIKEMYRDSAWEYCWNIVLSRGLEPNESGRMYLEGDSAIEGQRIDIQRLDPDSNGYFDSLTNTIRVLPDMETEFTQSSSVKGEFQIEKIIDPAPQVPAAGGKISYTYIFREFRFGLN